MDVSHIKPERRSPPLVDADWHAFCQALYKGIEGEDGEDSRKAMSKAVGVKKPQEARKARALWAMQAAEDGKEEFYDPARKDNLLGRNETRQELWEEHLEDPNVALNKALTCVKDQYQSWLEALWKQGKGFSQDKVPIKKS